MRFTRIELRNWRNFLAVDVPLRERVFLVGPNASGKSNFLDAFRFLHDVAEPRGGLQEAIARRGGVGQLCSLHAEPGADVVVAVEAALSDDGSGRSWAYRLELGQDERDRPVIRREIVRHGDQRILARPDPDDRSDPGRLTQTYLEQLSANHAFRALQEGFAQIRYLHIVPQLVRDPERGHGREADPYGADFVLELARLPRETFEGRLQKMLPALRAAAPSLAEMELARNQDGTVHLRSRCSHWRQDAWQLEQQLSDGTLRLFGLLWALLDGGPLLLEEPELSLHAAVIRYLPLLLAEAVKGSGRQTLVSTHCAELLTDEGIAAEEVLLFEPSNGDTRVVPASSDGQIRALLDGGLTIGDAVVPKTAPPEAGRILRFTP